MGPPTTTTITPSSTTTTNTTKPTPPPVPPLPSTATATSLPKQQEADNALEHFHTYSKLIQQQKEANENEDHNPNTKPILLELNPEPWRDIILRALSHATDSATSGDCAQSGAAGRTGATATRGKGRSGGVTAGISATDATLQFLVTSLDRYHAKRIEIEAVMSGSGGNSTTSADGDNSVMEPTNTATYDGGDDDDSSAIAVTTRVSPEIILVDALWLTGTRLGPDDSSTPAATTTSTKNDEEGYKTLCTIINNLIYGTIMPHARRNNLIHLLQTSLEAPLLAGSGVISKTNPKNYIVRLKRLNTNMYYRQKKVNLMQEESEGYAKFFSFLVSLPSLDLEIDGDDDVGDDIVEQGAIADEPMVDTKDTNATSEDDTKLTESQQPQNEPTSTTNTTTRSQKQSKQTVTTIRVRELIGAFDLDPNRVLSLTLDVLEGQLDSMVQPARAASGIEGKLHWDRIVRHAPDHAVTVGLLLEIVRMFPKENVSHLIGFKISSYLSSTEMAVSAVGGDTNGGEKPSSPLICNPPNKAASPKRNGTEPTPKKSAAGAKKAELRTTYGLIAKQTPQSLYLTTAILCAHSLLSLPSLVPHLQNNHDTTTGTEDVRECYAIWSNETRAIIKKMGAISLNNTNKDTTKGGGVKYSSEQVIHRLEVGCETNHMVQILQMLIQVGLDWKDVTNLFCVVDNHGEEEEVVRHEQEEAVIACCSIYPPLGRSLCHYMFSLVEGVYHCRVDGIGIQLCRPPTDGNGDGDGSEDNDDFGSFSLLPTRLIDGPSSDKPRIIAADKTTLLELSQVMTGLLASMVETGCIASEPVIYCKMCRLVRVLLVDHINATTSEDDIDNNDLIIEEPVVNLLQRFLIPSLSHFPHNLSISDELWSVVSLLPYHIRYVLYDSWRGPGLEKAALTSSSSTTYDDKPLVQIQSEVSTMIHTRWLLRRMSRDNVRDMGRQISKVSHNNPLVLFTLVLSQIESYNNFIGMVVDMFKFVGGLGLDVLGYCLLGSLGGLQGSVSGEEARAKVMEDGLSKAQWFASLETFTGIFYKKFAEVNLHGLLAYILRRLRDGHVEELGVLQSLLKVTGGYAFADCGSTAKLSPLQLEGRCGTKLLKRETSDFGVVAKVNERANKRLREVLHQDGFGIVYLILLSQIRSRVLFGESESKGDGRGRTRKKQIKLIGNLNDCCRKTMYILQACVEDFSTDRVDGQKNQKEKRCCLLEKYAKSFPTLGDLHLDYGVDTATAWMLCRALVRRAEDDKTNDGTNTSSLPIEKDSSKVTSSSYLKRFDASSESMRSTYTTMLPNICWSHLTPLLFSEFYSLRIYDLYCPNERYEIEVDRLKKQVEHLSHLQKGGNDARRIKSALAASAAAAGGTEQQIRDATTFTKSHEVELEQKKRQCELLAEDFRKQRGHCESITVRLRKEKDKFLVGIIGVKCQLLTASYFLTYCVYPRCTLSPDDALFCSRFVKGLHLMDTKGFFTLQFFDCVVNAVIGSVYCITEDEAANLGILLEETWELISLWRYDAEEYGRAVANKPGATWSSLNDVDTATATTNTSTKDKEAVLYSMTHSEFITLYNRWHAQLGTTFIGGLKSSEYMHTRISLVLLTRIVSHFPTKSKLGEKFGTVLKPLQSDENPMQDIKTMAQGYESQLSKIKWKEEDSKVTKERLEKERKEKERKKINSERQFKEIAKEMEQPAREQPVREQPARSGSTTRATLNWVPADQSPRAERSQRSADPRSRPTNNKDKNNEAVGPLAIARRWEPSERSNAVGGNSNSDQNKRINTNKRQRSPDRASGVVETNHVGGDPKRNRSSARPRNSSADPRESTRNNRRR